MDNIIKKHFRTYLLILILYIITVPAGLLFWVFLFKGSFTIIDLHLGRKGSLIADAVLSSLFFLQHSILVRPFIKLKLSGLIPGSHYSAFYSLTSGISLFILLVLWQKPDAIIFSADGVFKWCIWILFFLCNAGFFRGSRSFSSFDVLGVKRLMRYINRRPEQIQKITAKGAYRYSRHPLYLFMILLIWSCPVITSDRLLFNILWTLWVLTGTYLEDRDLKREFGTEYIEYSRKVPMLIPYKFFRQEKF